MSSPLELLFDLTFVIAFGVAAEHFSESITAGHTGAGLAGFTFATFAVCWAWINFSWFASAYDTDDWAYRLLTMLQMIGVLVLSLGIPSLFSSIAAGRHIDNRVMVAGYVVMRIALVAQWLRAARQDRARRSAGLAYAAVIALAQLGWIAVIVVDASMPMTFGLAGALIGFELSGPWLIERRVGATAWHAHHIAERYGLLTIIALGEGMVGAVASLSAVVANQGWTVNAALIALAGTTATFGMWWVYFVVPFGDLVHTHRRRSFWFGYLHIVVFGSVLATGAGLRVAAAFLEGHNRLPPPAIVLAAAVPVSVYLAAVCALYCAVAGTVDALYLSAVALAGLVAATAVGLAALGVSIPVCLTIVAAAPTVIVLAFELGGHRRVAEVLAGY